MIIIRNTFIAKPGMASKLAKQMKEAAALAGMPSRVLTDLTGDFNSVVLEFEAESLSEFEKRMKEREGNQEMGAKMAGYTDLWITGSRQILRVM